MPLPLLLSLLVVACAPPVAADLVAEAPEAGVPPSNMVVALDHAPPASERRDVELGAQAAVRLEEALRAAPSRRLGVVLDRPLYRPGETIWVRSFDLSARSMGANEAASEVQFELLDPRGNRVVSLLRSAEKGGARASIELPSSAAGGLYTLRVHAGGQTLDRPVVVASFEEPKIRKELELLREAYGPGDQVEAAVTVASAGAGPLANHPIQVLVQVGGQPRPRIEVRTDDNGEAIVRFELPDDLSVSDVLLTVLVEEGGWQESISRPVPVVLDEVRLEWFPEGGDLVTGLRSRLYLRARNAHGEPADIAGVVVDDKGLEVAAFRTVHDGLGRLPLVPQRGRTYTARLTEPAALAGQSFLLPRAKGEGCVLTAFDDLDGSLSELRVGVRCSSERDVVVAEVHRDQVIDSAVVTAGPSDMAVVYLRAQDPFVDASQGVARVTLLDEGLEPIAERLVYRNRGHDLAIEVTPDKTQYGPREEVVLTVTTRDPDGEPVPADVALSVVDDRLLTFADDEEGNLLTQLHLDPWLVGTVEDPAWYLDPEEEDGALGLDLVMGTFGWRRFARVAKEKPLSSPDAGEGARAKREEGRVQRKELDRQMAGNAGVLGALGAQPVAPFLNIEGGIGGLIGTGIGIGGLGSRGRGGGGMAEVLGGLGTKGIGSGKSGYGTSGGNFGAKGESIATARIGGDPIILGSLDRALIDDVVRRNMNRIRYCYQRELHEYPGLGGKVVIKFTVGKDGLVSAASTRATTMKHSPVESCIVGRFMRMRFPKPPGGGIAIVSYPLVFTSDGYRGPPLYGVVREFPVPDYASLPTPSVRTDFRSTVMWAPMVQTGQDGTAEVRFTLSDAVTTFNVVAEGVGGGHVGRVEHELDSTLPFVLDVPIPQQVSFGDRLLLPVRVTSRRPEAVDVALSANIGSLLEVEEGTDQQQIALSAGGAQTTVIPLTVPQGQGTATVQISAASAGLTDAVERAIEVVPRGFPHTWSASGELSARVTHSVNVLDALPGSRGGQLTLYPTALTNLLDGLEDMVRLPGGCFEQTSSSNYPNILVMQNLDRTGRGAKLKVDRHRALRTGYERLVGYQIEAGGFETFGSGPGKEVLSAYGLLQFTDMKQVYREVDPAMLQRDVAFLNAARDGTGGFHATGRSSHNYGGASAEINDAFITWAMVETGHTDLPAELARQRTLAKETKDPYLLALAVLTLQHVDVEAAEQAVRRLAALQEPDGSYPGAETTVVGSRGANVLVETTAMATLAMVRAQGTAVGVRLAAKWLSAARGSYGWGSTQATVLALKALDAASTSGAANKNLGGSVDVFVDEARAGSLTWTGRETQPLTLDLSEWLGDGQHRIELRAHGAAVPYALEASWNRDTPANHSEAPLTLHTTLASNNTALGEPVRLTALVANGTTSGVASPIARIGLPAGTRVETWQLEAMRDRGEIAYFETRPREITLYWEGFEAQETREIALDLIPEVPGSFTAPPSSIYPYYDGEQVSWAPGSTLNVEL